MLNTARVNVLLFARPNVRLVNGSLPVPPLTVAWPDGSAFSNMLPLVDVKLTTWLLAPTVPGEIIILELDGVNEYMVQKDGFLAGADGVTINSQMQSMSRGLLGGEGFFILKMSGRGMLLLNSFGAVHKIELKPGQEYIVDNSHLVAWSTTTTYNIEKATSGWVASFTSGEGFVCRFRGPGLVFIQSRNPGGFGAWVRQFIPVSE